MRYKYVFFCRFPCTVENCNKEYRTQWELNSHNRLKHTKAESNDVQGVDYVNPHGSERLCDQPIKSLIKDGKKTSSVPKKARKSKQQIIYVMPGPVEDVISLEFV